MTSEDEPPQEQTLVDEMWNRLEATDPELAARLRAPINRSTLVPRPKRPTRRAAP